MPYSYVFVSQFLSTYFKQLRNNVLINKITRPYVTRPPKQRVSVRLPRKEEKKNWYKGKSLGECNYGLRGAPHNERNKHLRGRSNPAQDLWKEKSTRGLLYNERRQGGIILRGLLSGAFNTDLSPLLLFTWETFKVSVSVWRLQTKNDRTEWRTREVLMLKLSKAIIEKHL